MRTIDQDSPYRSQLDDVSFSPVFILGPHRSGTTILFEALARTGSFNVTTAYHIVNRHRLLHLHFNGLRQQARDEITAFLSGHGLRDREYDRIRVGPDTAEEYAHALEHQGRRPMLTPRNLPSFLEFCRKVQLTEDPSKLLLLKNPYDVRNFRFLQATFPHARFIFVHRNPVPVISSQIRTIVQVLERRHEYEMLVLDWYRRVYNSTLLLAMGRAIYSDRLPLLFHQVAYNLARNCDYLRDQASTFGPAAIHVTYPEFCKSPTETIARILQFLGLKPTATTDLDGLIEPRHQTLHPRVAAHRQAIERRNAGYCRTFGV